MNATRANVSQKLPSGAAPSAVYEASGCRADRGGNPQDGDGSRHASPVTAAVLIPVPVTAGAMILTGTASGCGERG
jgi:hypothetical protein